MSGPRKGGQQLARLRTELSPRDVAILGTVAELRLAGTGQIERLHFADGNDVSPLSAARRCRRSLERLVRQALLHRLGRRIGGLRAGSASFIYAIAPAGQRVIRDVRPRRRFREPSTMFVDHTLAVAELFVRLHEAQAAGDLELASRPQAEPRCWRGFSDHGLQAALKPDLFVHLLAGDYEFRWFIEVDLGTEHRPAITRKCQTYESYYRSGVEQVRHVVFPRVLWVAPDETRARQITGAIDHASGLTSGLFVVTTASKAIGVLTGVQS